MAVDMQPIFAHPEIVDKKDASLKEVKGSNVNFKFHRVGFRPYKDANGRDYPQDSSFFNTQTVPPLTCLANPQGKYSFQFEAMAIVLDGITGN